MREHDQILADLLTAQDRVTFKFIEMTRDFSGRVFTVEDTEVVLDTVAELLSIDADLYFRHCQITLKNVGAYPDE